ELKAKGPADREPTQIFPGFVIEGVKGRPRTAKFAQTSGQRIIPDAHVVASKFRESCLASINHHTSSICDPAAPPFDCRSHTTYGNGSIFSAAAREDFAPLPSRGPFALG